MLSYAGKTTSALRNDPRFRVLVREKFPSARLKWDSKRPLSAEIIDIFYSYPGEQVLVTSNRFVTLRGEFQGSANGKALLWCEVAVSSPKMIFVSLDESLIHEGSAKVDIYADHDGIGPALPPELVTEVLAWEKELRISMITSVTMHDAQNRTTSLPAAMFTEH